MNIYYIDYENVTSQGLKGVDALTENDEVVLLYSKKADNVKIEMLTMLMASKAKIRFLPVHVGTPNALDFQLVTLLFLNYKDSDHCYIISKDSGYDCCIKTAAENGAPNVARYPNIESAVKGIPAKKTRRSRRTAQESSVESPSPAAKDAVKDTGKEAVPDPVVKGENNPEPQTDAPQNKKAEAAAPQPAKAKTSQNQKSRSRRQNAKNQSGQNKESQNMNAQSSASDQAKTPAAASAVTQTQTNEQPKAQKQNNPQEQKSAQAADNSQKQQSARTPDNSQEQNSAQAQNNSKTQTPAHGQSMTENQAPNPEQDKNQVQSQTQSQAQVKKQADVPQNKESDDSGKSAPAENVLQQRYLSKQFEPKGLQADKAKSEAEKPVSILSVIRRRNDVQLDMHQVDLIRSALKESGNKQQFYSYFVKNLGQKQGIELYHSIKSSYTDLVNANLL